jgi:hypothetical protein
MVLIATPTLVNVWIEAAVRRQIGQASLFRHGG